MVDISTTPAQALAAVREYFLNLDADRAQFRDWAGGSATGGPNADGSYPLTDFTGNVHLVPSPAKLAAIVDTVYDYTPSAPYDHVANVTAADADVADGPFTGLWIGSPGSVTLRLTSGADVPFPDCFAGQTVEASFSQVRAATTAGNLVALDRRLALVLANVNDVVEIAPADVDLPAGPALSLLIGGEALDGPGQVAIRAIDGSEAVFVGVPASSKLPVRVSRVRAATTSTAIRGLMS